MARPGGGRGRPAPRGAPSSANYSNPQKRGPARPAPSGPPPGPRGPPGMNRGPPANQFNRPAQAAPRPPLGGPGGPAVSSFDTQQGRGKLSRDLI